MSGLPKGPVSRPSLEARSACQISPTVSRWYHTGYPITIILCKDAAGAIGCLTGLTSTLSSESSSDEAPELESDDDDDDETRGIPGITRFRARGRLPGRTNGLIRMRPTLALFFFGFAGAPNLSSSFMDRETAFARILVYGCNLSQSVNAMHDMCPVRGSLT